MFNKINYIKIYLQEVGIKDSELLIFAMIQKQLVLSQEHKRDMFLYLC